MQIELGGEDNCQATAFFCVLMSVYVVVAVVVVYGIIFKRLLPPSIFINGLNTNKQISRDIDRH